jgi:NAD(P)-dependent dehydrogenase (short-subunit alcohol dehydrogenase family)
LVRQFRSKGAKLILTDVTERALLDVVGAAGDDLIVAIATDLASEEGCDTVVETCTSRGVVPDILVNNAGIGVAGRLDNVPRDHWESLMQLNLLAPMRLCNQFLPGMIKRGSGHIVNVSSLAGWAGAKGLSAYCASKFGLRGFGVSLAADLESPQFGYEERTIVPAYLISEPSDVVARMMEGVRRNRLHVFPDKYARSIHYVTRFAPWLLPLLDRRLQAQSTKADKKAN